MDGSPSPRDAIKIAELAKSSPVIIDFRDPLGDRTMKTLRLNRAYVALAWPLLVSALLLGA